MRAPSLARMAAVAAPRPDADPVTITHTPSADIRLVMAVAFPRHAPQENTAPEARRNCRADMCRLKTGNAVAEVENIVAETAEKIFADLADAQTVNRDAKGGWKAPL